MLFSFPVSGHSMGDWGVVAVFATVYLGMFLGGLPRLKLDRAGVALLGAIAMLGLGVMDSQTAAQAIDLPTILLLFAFMVLAAQMGLGGFYTELTRRVVALPLARPALLGALIAVAGALSAVFSNDVVCLALTPLVARMCQKRGLDPLPFLIGLACAANIGSAATLIGNPQNMLIGSLMKLDFGAYLRQALPPVLAGLVLLWAWLAHGPGARGVAPPARPASVATAADEPVFDRWQSAKGLLVALALMLAFLFTDWPREICALVGAGVLLLSRRFHSSHVMGAVDWELLVLFMGLFVVNHAFERTGLAAQAVAWAASHGVSLDQPATLMGVGLVLSNLVSNVPAVMLILPHLGTGEAGAHNAVALALVSTFAGNLLLVGSIANLIVADLARREGLHLDWKRHLATGLPVTLATLAGVWAWLWWI
jgi:Na+/H+ antiporter NhaD/arsenite permease-like protein